MQVNGMVWFVQQEDTVLAVQVPLEIRVNPINAYLANSIQLLALKDKLQQAKSGGPELRLPSPA
jgi:hypothetical protein